MYYKAQCLDVSHVVLLSLLLILNKDISLGYALIVGINFYFLQGVLLSFMW